MSHTTTCCIIRFESILTLVEKITRFIRFFTTCKAILILPPSSMHQIIILIRKQELSLYPAQYVYYIHALSSVDEGLS